MTPIILFRKGYDDPDEAAVAAKYLPVVELRSAVPTGSLVIGRYSVLPFYRELEQDVAAVGGALINTYRQHRYIADMGNWYRDLQGITPETWNHIDAVPDHAWPCVLKGETNSKKWQWDAAMFAKDRNAGFAVMARLQQDSVLCDQTIYFRTFVPLRGVGIDRVVAGPPVSREYRFFVCDGRVLCGGYYWACFDRDDIDPYPDAGDVPAAFVAEVIERVGANARFYVVDVAQTEAGDWIVVELNDGQMSGLSDCDADELYRNLKEAVR
jgi:hypothetical protein